MAVNEIHSMDVDDNSQHSVFGCTFSGSVVFSHSELTAMNDILTSMLHIESVDLILTKIYKTLSDHFGLRGCAFYRISANQLGLHLVYGVGDYKEAIPDVIPQGSFQFQTLQQGNLMHLTSFNQDQLSLFDDIPLTLLSPISVDSDIIGAFAAIYPPANSCFFSIICRHIAIMIELLYRASCLIDYMIDEHTNHKNDANEHEDLQSKLTSREKEVLALLTDGLSNKEIAKILYISSATCKHHVQNILVKLQVPTRAAAVAVGLGRTHHTNRTEQLSKTQR